MPILLSCPCGKRLRIPDASAGKKVRCPGCGQVQTAPAPTPPEEPELLEIVPESPPARREEADRVKRSPGRPRPVPPAEELSAPNSPRDTAAEVIELIPAGKAGKEERWRLELSDDGVRLLDDDGEVAMKFARHKANTRIAFPNFWFNVRYLQFLDGISPKYQFRPAKEVLARIREYLDNALREDPLARRKLKLHGLGWVLVGLIVTSFGAAFFAYLWTTKTLTLADGFISKATGVSVAAFIAGFGLMVRGILMYCKAARMAKE